jgi:hypothetical protein
VIGTALLTVARQHIIIMSEDTAAIQPGAVFHSPGLERRSKAASLEFLRPAALRAARRSRGGVGGSGGATRGGRRALIGSEPAASFLVAAFLWHCLGDFYCSLAE